MKFYYRAATLEKPVSCLAVTNWDSPTPSGYKVISKSRAIAQAQIWKGWKSELEMYCTANGEIVSPELFIAIVSRGF